MADQPPPSGADTPTNPSTTPDPATAQAAAAATPPATPPAADAATPAPSAAPAPAETAAAAATAAAPTAQTPAAAAETPAPAGETAAAATAESSAQPADATKSSDEVLSGAQFEDVSAVVAAAPPTDAEAFKLPNFQQVMADAQVSSIDLLRDVELNVKIELGRSRMMVEDVLKLSEGSVVELDKLAGDPVDVFVNDRLVARGEVLVLNDNFCVRVNEIVAGVKEEVP
ncbi:MAG: flagellar motor switch protein FliN [Tepidisphaeraceae bacterium]|jgi:flagellar motor switch protein FliN/FliY